jgi:hypothetical protein
VIVDREGVFLAVVPLSFVLRVVGVEGLDLRVDLQAFQTELGDRALELVDRVGFVWIHAREADELLGELATYLRDAIVGQRR